MIVVMKAHASQRDIEYVTDRASSLGLKTHLSRHGDQTLISLLGDLQDLSPGSLTGLSGVERVVPMAQSFRLVSRNFKSEDTTVSIGECRVGGEQVVIMAGPCSVESRDQLMEAAWSVKKSGAQLLRGGAFKPRTSPYGFQGLGEEGLQLLAEARRETGLPVVTEVMTPDQVDLVAQYADVLQIGTRNMQNFALLHAVGESKKPVLLKRGMMSTIEELLLSAEYVLSHGNHSVMLCERGIRTFETYTRNTLDINAVPALKELTHLPVVVDPSQGTGRSSLVTATSSAAVAAGADGLLIEVHPDPERALTDGFQSIGPQQFSGLVTQVRRVAQALHRFV